jgi:hypothetical protein
VARSRSMEESSGSRRSPDSCDTKGRSGPGKTYE